MTADPDYHIEERDIMRVCLIDLAPDIPEYNDRAESYMQSIINLNPQIILINGLSPKEYTLIGGLSNHGTLTYGDYHKSRGESAPCVNAIWVAPNIEVREQRTIRISKMMDNGTEIVLAPDGINVTIYHRGRTVDIFCYESIPGAFHGTARTTVATIINKEAYMTKKARPDSLLVMGANMHAESDSQSVRYIEGKDTIMGNAPSGWRDIWDELRMDTSMANSATERLETRSLFDDDLVLPQFMRAKRTSFLFAYNDVFGKIGTPIRIERNGTESTSNGTPYSDTYGLTMGMYLPTYNKFTTGD